MNMYDLYKYILADRQFETGITNRRIDVEAAYLKKLPTYHQIINFANLKLK